MKRPRFERGLHLYPLRPPHPHCVRLADLV